MARPVDWEKVFSLDTPLLEIFVRGSIVYLVLFVLFRFVLKREAGTVGIADLLVVVLVADAAQNAMAGEYTSVPDGLVLVATIAFWSYALNWLGYRFPFVEKLVHPPPRPLIKDGKLVRQNLRHEMITIEELKTQLREQGVDRVEDVKSACMEGDGHISVVTKDKESHPSPDRSVS